MANPRWSINVILNPDDVENLSTVEEYNTFQGGDKVVAVENYDKIVQADGRCAFVFKFFLRDRLFVNPTYTILQCVPMRNGCNLLICHGSVLTFVGSAIVNAANPDLRGGSGLDAAVHAACGPDLQRALGAALSAGEAVTTPSFNHTKVEHVIHAVGPNFNKPGEKKDGYDKLTAAYKAALQEGKDCHASSIGFGLLSGSIFRGNEPLSEIIDTAVATIIGGAYRGLDLAILFLYTSDEAKYTWTPINVVVPDETKMASIYNLDAVETYVAEERSTVERSLVLLDSHFLLSDKPYWTINNEKMSLKKALQIPEFVRWLTRTSHSDICIAGPGIDKMDNYRLIYGWGALALAWLHGTERVWVNFISDNNIDCFLVKKEHKTPNIDVLRESLYGVQFQNPTTNKMVRFSTMWRSRHAEYNKLYTKLKTTAIAEPADEPIIRHNINTSECIKHMDYLAWNVLNERSVPVSIVEAAY